MTRIKGYHAHVYFDVETTDQAEKLCLEAGEKFRLSVGTRHHKPVGPHPMWSCQLAFTPAVFDQVIPWLAMNRDGLTIFIHTITGNDLADHTKYAMWMGTIEKLDLTIFEP